MWLRNLGSIESIIRDQHRVCSKHFPKGIKHNLLQPPSLGPQFISPRKAYSERAKEQKTEEHFHVISPPSKRRQSTNTPEAESADSEQGSEQDFR